MTAASTLNEDECEKINTTTKKTLKDAVLEGLEEKGEGKGSWLW